GEIVSYLTSGNYGHFLGRAVGLGYVPSAGEAAADVLGSSFEIEVAGQRYRARASLKPMYDPTSARMRDIELATATAA
ncbi:MAG: glycine cleavage T C-terminal barrel domain-containing protein, partial [Pseudomonadota bacterium]